MTKIPHPRVAGMGQHTDSTNVIHHINKMKDKTHMIISLDAEKTFDKIQHPLMIKVLGRVGIQRTHLYITNVSLSREAFPFKSGIGLGVHSLYSYTLQFLKS